MVWRRMAARLSLGVGIALGITALNLVPVPRDAAAEPRRGGLPRLEFETPPAGPQHAGLPRPVRVPGTLRGVMGYRLPLVSRQEVPGQVVSGVLIPAHTTYVILQPGSLGTGRPVARRSRGAAGRFQGRRAGGAIPAAFPWLEPAPAVQEAKNPGEQGIARGETQRQRGHRPGPGGQSPSSWDSQAMDGGSWVRPDGGRGWTLFATPKATARCLPTSCRNSNGWRRTACTAWKAWRRC